MKNRKLVISEADARVASIDPILDALLWDTRDLRLVRNEYSVDGRKVDYALLLGRNPGVFIEAKRPGLVDSEGEDQLFQYATNQGVPLLILTDGDQWNFYLSMEAGHPTDRMFYSFKFSESNDLNDSIDKLNRCLNRKGIVSGSALTYAHELHAKKTQPEKTKHELVRVWNHAIETEEPFIVDFLIEEVMRDSGIKADKEVVLEFLSKLKYEDEEELTGRNIVIDPTPKPPKNDGRKVNKKPKIVGFIYQNRKYSTKSAFDTLKAVILELSKEEKDLLSLIEKETLSNKRTWVSRDKNNLFDRDDLVQKHSFSLKRGWYIGSNIGTNVVRKRIQGVCELAGVRFGKDLTLIERE